MILAGDSSSLSLTAKLLALVLACADTGKRRADLNKQKKKSAEPLKQTKKKSAEPLKQTKKKERRAA